MPGPDAHRLGSTMEVAAYGGEDAMSHQLEIRHAQLCQQALEAASPTTEERRETLIQAAQLAAHIAATTESTDPAGSKRWAATATRDRAQAAAQGSNPRWWAGE